MAQGNQPTAAKRFMKDFAMLSLAYSLTMDYGSYRTWHSRRLSTFPSRSCLPNRASYVVLIVVHFLCRLVSYNASRFNVHPSLSPFEVQKSACLETEAYIIPWSGSFQRLRDVSLRSLVLIR